VHETVTAVQVNPEHVVRRELSHLVPIYLITIVVDLL